MTFRVPPFGTPGPAQEEDVERVKIKAHETQRYWRYRRTLRIDIGKGEENHSIQGILA